MIGIHLQLMEMALDWPVTAQIVADLTGGNLAGLVNSINAQSTTTSITAAEQDGQVVLTKADGTTFS